MEEPKSLGNSKHKGLMYLSLCHAPSKSLRQRVPRKCSFESYRRRDKRINGHASIGMLCGQPHCGHVPELFHPGKRGRRILLQLFPVISDSLALLAGPAQGAEQCSVDQGNGMYMKWGA
jgi:hypothetical protein